MPLYDFVCQNCANHFDLLVSYDWKAAGAVCPDCGSTELEKIVSRVGGFSTGGKMSMAESNHSCGSCHTGGCSTCH